jgi:long-chain acyl-CoA synthetase
VLVADRGYDGRLRKGDCFPLTILNMQVLTTVLTAQALGCAVIMDRIDAAGVAEWIERERVTTWNGPPALLYSLCEHPDVRAEALGSLDEVWTGGADCPESLRERFAARFGRPVLATYGLTEAPSVVSIDPRSGSHRPGASGRPLPHLAVTIRDSTDAELPIGEDGEVCVGAVGAGQWAALWRPMLGYRSRPEASVETLRGGVLHTGDIGHLDTNGFLHLRDRLSLVIIRGGANVYPAEVERVLMDIDGVAAAAVYGIADERLGERVMAVVEATPAFPLDTEELRVQCARELARYKVPERIEVVDELPRNAMGKIVRAGLAEFVSRRARPATPSD